MPSTTLASRALGALAALALGAAPALGAPITIDPGAYPGRYSIDGGPLRSGSATLDLAAGPHQVSVFQSGTFIVDVDAAGQLSVRDPAIAESLGSTLRFRTTTLNVDPADFGGLYRLGDGNAFASGVRGWVVMNGLNATLMVHPGVTFVVLMGATGPTGIGNASSQVPPAIVLPDGTVRLETTSLVVDPADYPGPVQVSGAPALRGPATWRVVAGLPTLVQPWGGDSFTVHVDATTGAWTTATKGAADVLSGGTVRLRTVTLTVDPGAFPGAYSLGVPYDVHSVTPPRTGVQTWVCVTGVGTWLTLPGGARCYVLRDAAGTISVDNRTAVTSAQGDRLVLGNVLVRVDPGTYTSSYRVAGVSPLAGMVDITLVPGIHVTVGVGTVNQFITPFADRVQPGSLTFNHTSGTHTFTLSIVAPNVAPVADAGPNQVVEADESLTAVVTLDGRGSTDPDGDPLTYSWSGPFGATSGSTANVTLGIGAHTATLVVNDGTLDSAPDTASILVTVRVQGLEPPLASLAPLGSAAPLSAHAFRQGRTLPLRMGLFAGTRSLTDGDVSAPRIVELRLTGAPIDLTTIDPDPGLSNDSGLTFRFTGTQWAYNLSTSSLAAGTYELVVEAPDGRRYVTGFVLR